VTKEAVLYKYIYMPKNINSFNKLNFDQLNNTQLLQLWKNLKYTDTERYFLYKQILSRNITNLIQNKVNKDEYICSIFEQGFLGSGGCITFLDVFVYILPLGIITAYLLMAKNNVLHFIIYNKNVYEICILLFMFFLLLMITNSFFQRFIIVTNKSIATYTVLFRTIKFNFKKTIIDKDHQAFTKLTFFMGNGHTYIYKNLLKSIYIIFDIVFLNSNYISFRCILNSYRLLMFQEWLQLIFNKKQNNIFLFDITNTINQSINYNIAYSSDFIPNSFCNFFNMIEKISDDKLINIDKNKNLVSIKNLLNKKNNNFKEYDNQINTYSNELFFNVHTLSLNIHYLSGVIGYVRLIDNDILFIDKRSHVKRKYSILDKNLTFSANLSYGLSFYYKNDFLFYIRFLDITFPLLDYLLFLKNGVLNV
jgi:hypothetical protein